LALRAVRAGFRDAAAVAALAVFTLVFWARFFFGGLVFYSRDLGSFFAPLRAAYSAAISSGAAPLWNSFLGAGVPMAADPNNAVFFPPTLLFAPLPLASAIRLSSALWLFAFPLCAYWGLRLLRASRAASWAAAAALSICGPSMTLTSFLPLPWASMLFLPIVALAWRGAQGEPRHTIAAGILLGIGVLAGEPVIAVHLAVAAAVFAVTRDRRASARRVAAIAMIAAFVAAPQIVAALQLLPATARGSGLPLRFGAAFNSVRPLRVLGFIWPALFGDIRSPEVWGFWGKDFFDASGPYISSLALGTATLALLPAGMRSRAGRRFLILAGFAVVASFGRFLPWGEVFLSLPGISIFRYPEKWLFLAGAAMIAAAGFGLDSLAADDAGARRAVRRAGAALAALSVAGLFLIFAVPDQVARVMEVARAASPDFRPAWPAIRRALMADAAQTALFAAAAALAVSRWRGRRLLAALAVLVLADLYPRTWNWTPLATRAYYDSPPAAVRLVRALPGRFHYAEEEERAEDPMRPMKPAIWGISYAGNNDIDRFSPRRSFFFGLDLARMPMSDPRKAALLRLADVHTLSTIDPTAATVAGVRMIMRTSAVRTVYALDGGRRFRLLNTAEVAKDETDSRARLLSPGFDPERIAILEGGNALRPVSPGDCRGAVRTLRSRAGAETVEIEAPGRCVLVRSETFDPHWRAEIDGAPGLVVPADFAFQGVVVPAGRHVVSFRYRDRATVVAMIVSLATLVGCAGVLRRQRDDGKSRPAYPVSST
jgi:hypothetical protein